MLRRPLGILSKTCPKSRILRKSLTSTVSYSLVSRILQSAKSCSCHTSEKPLTSWKQSRITGLLENEPFNITDLHGGQIVEVREEDVFDYIRQYPDKHREGNTTGEILRKLNEEKSGKSNHAGGDGQTLSQPGSTECSPD